MPASGERLPRWARIRRTNEIRALLRRGRRRSVATVDVFLSPSTAPRSRVGVIVAKHGRGIVARNLVRRRLREIARRDVLPGLTAAGRSSDVLIRARPAAYDAGFEELVRDVGEAVEALCSRGS